jgi:hypothetical protein
MAGWNTITAFVLDQVFGYQTANKIRDNLMTLGTARIRASLGGSRYRALPAVASAQDAIDYLDFEIDWTYMTGMSVIAKVECRTMAAGTSITPKIRNLTDGSDAVTGNACTATATTWDGTNQAQDLTIPAATGTKKYRLQGTPSNTTNDTFIIGQVHVYPTSP